ncbi:hypothetical protein EV02_0001 [Prochlorococcus marinus str. SB]|uniref:Uncharacterized protein n=1 Tax=Prochlorococcus marinus str. SB TaxID=59926 RepID=A0A0A2B5P5_PROMR|nr:hypothetical protein EV02_0001 [Prochlorococcus marinus str. SB]
MSSISISEVFLGLSLKIKFLTLKVSEEFVKFDKSREPEVISFLKV